MALRKIPFRFALLLALVTLPGLAQADALTDQAKALLDQGKSQAAYDLLAPVESERAGDEAYDLLLGIAAVDIGRNTNAVFALERVLASSPNNARARAEIARAFLALGETQTARKEFELVRERDVPPAVKQTIDRFLSAIERIQDEGRTTIKAYAELSLGWDSNVNAATSSRDVAVPVFGGLLMTLSPAGVKQSDSYTGLTAGANLRMPLTRELALLAGVSGNKRMNSVRQTFDTGSFDGNAGLALTQDKNVYSATVQGGMFNVDAKDYRGSTGLSAQWQHNYDQRNQATAFLQHTDLAYPSVAQLYLGRKRDAVRTVGGVGFAHASRDFKTLFYGSAYVGDEKERSSGVSELGFQLSGVRGGAQYQYRDDMHFFANVSYERRGYGGRDPFFLVQRADDSTSVGLGAAYVPAKHWKVTPQYQFTQNKSNIVINDYKRDVVTVTVRYDF